MSEMVVLTKQPMFECSGNTNRTQIVRRVMLWLFENDADLQACSSELYGGKHAGPTGFAYTIVYDGDVLEDHPEQPAARILVSLPHLHMRSLCHEIFHSVMHIFDMDLGGSRIMDNDDQEVAAYMISDITYELFSQLKAKGYLRVDKL